EQQLFLAAGLLRLALLLGFGRAFGFVVFIILFLRGLFRKFAVRVNFLFTRVVIRRFAFTLIRGSGRFIGILLAQLVRRWGRLAVGAQQPLAIAVALRGQGRKGQHHH